MAKVRNIAYDPYVKEVTLRQSEVDALDRFIGIATDVIDGKYTEPLSAREWKKIVDVWRAIQTKR